MNKLVIAIICLSTCFMLNSCASNTSNQPNFTLRNGVTLNSVKDYSGNEITQPIAVTKNKDSYLFTITSFVDCADIEPPWLTMNNNKKATLVLVPKASRTGFNASSECAKTFSIQIVGRVESGDTVYVLNNREVIGHVVLP